ASAGALLATAGPGGGGGGGLFDFENRKIFFKDVHASFKFCALVFGGGERRFDRTECAFFLHDTRTIADEDRCFPLAPDDFARANPNTGTAPVFRTRRDAEITRGIYECHPVLVDRSGGGEVRAWPVRYATMFHMTNDSHRFRTAEQLDSEGFYPVQGNRWKRRKELYLPLYQGRMISQFDHRANSVRINPASTHNPYLSEEVTEEQHADPGFLPQAQFWVPAADVEGTLPQGIYSLAFREIARPTDARTVIASMVPWAGYGNKVPLLVQQGRPIAQEMLMANLNAFCLDFVARQKIHGTTLNWYIVEQFPVIAPADYDRPFGATTAGDLVRDHVLRLTYTAHDMSPFARDLGHDGPPFPWDEEERRHLRARLDALYFHLYGLTREDAGYVLDTFPIVRKEDEAAFGRYRTQELILAYMNALAAGDVETRVAV
ncbi:MAG: restriction endonuclease, partial [Candidatus Aminicenantes bacterium]|nr:restriction endonuclease [Candidatus Aminicenantes bacterium]